MFFEQLFLAFNSNTLFKPNKKRNVHSLGKQAEQLRSGNDSVRVFTYVLLHICFSQLLQHLGNNL